MGDYLVKGLIHGVPLLFGLTLMIFVVLVVPLSA
jgi:hypothetical protein